MKEIWKKIAPEFFNDIESENKNFEIRKDEDDIQPGDILVLEEYIVGKYPPHSSKYTGKKVRREVEYVLRNRPDLGLQEGYCIIGMRKECSKDNRLVNLYKEILFLLNHAPSEEDCSEEEDEMYSDMANLKVSMEDAGFHD